MRYAVDYSIKKGEIKMNSNEYYDFLEMTKPIIEFLNTKCNPHQTVIITSESVKITYDDYCTPTEYIIKTAGEQK